MHTKTKEIDQVIEGLKSEPKYISSKYFYDERGSQLFEQITQLDEYYLTRTEKSIIQANIDSIANLIKPDTLMIEPGSGSNTKIKFLLEHCENISAYMPIDVSMDYMLEQAKDLQASYPSLQVYPLPGVYCDGLPEHSALGDYESKMIFYPGSSLGNFSSSEARKILENFAQVLGSGGQLLIGLDLVKDKKILELAYNDRAGVTAEFNLNALSNLNQIFSANFDLVNFKHLAFYNETESRIEMHLVSLCDQKVSLAGSEISITKDEKICTEYSYKYSKDQFIQNYADLMRIQDFWTDKNAYFGVFCFEIL